MASAQSDAAASLLEQLGFDVSKDTLSALQAVMNGIRMNLAAALTDTTDAYRADIFRAQGGWRAAFVTSRRSKQQLRRSILGVCEAITQNAGLMRRIKRLARPAIAERRAVAKEEAREEVRARALFRARLRSVRAGL